MGIRLFEDDGERLRITTTLTGERQALTTANILKAVAGGRKYKFSSKKTGKATFYLAKKPEPWPEDAQNIVQKKS